MDAIIAGDYAFEPAEYWSNVSDTARAFVTECLTIDPATRPTAEEALAHKWVRYHTIIRVFACSQVLCYICRP
jgi:calcium/calmodulin-dependent protein kinase I